MILLPRQVKGKHREKLKKRGAFFAGGVNVAAERAKSAELMKRKLDVALREVQNDLF